MNVKLDKERQKVRNTVKDTMPLCHRELSGDVHGLSAMTIINNFQQISAGAWIKRSHAEVIQDE